MNIKLDLDIIMQENYLKDINYVETGSIKY